MEIALVILAAGLVMLVVERAWPGRRWPEVAGWWPRAIALNAVQVASAYLAGVAYDGWLLRHRPWSADALGMPAGAALGYFAITGFYYVWHRARHESDLLWRWFHQVHHSPQRIELITSFYKHPGEMVVNSLIGSALVYTLLGLNIEAAGAYTACTALGEFFYHTNVRTPQWVGYVFQRPEMHRIHHQHGRHKNNYGDIVWWDMLFGTYENPGTFTGKCGFDDDKEQRLGAMLAYRDVHRE